LVDVYFSCCYVQVRNSFELVDALSNKIIPESYILCSFDVVSLFTNIPLDLAIDSITKRWEYLERATKITKVEFITAINFILSSTFFKFNEKIYQQTFGTPMGSPLSPIIADLTMRDLEENVLNTLNIRPLIYYRYVDDILLVASKEEIHVILNKFNNYHHRLQFTLEIEDNRSLNFLDVTLIIKNNRIITDWYKKTTCSGRYLSYYSNHPTSHKIGIIYNLVDRAIKLSHPSFHKKNLELVIKSLLDNGYPLNLIFNKINIRLKKLFIQRRETPTNLDNNNPKNEKKILVFPYVNPLTKFITANLDNSKVIIGYRCLNKLSQFVKVHKDIDLTLNRSNVIYKISCKNCEATYVGQTKRQLKTRAKEHKNNIKLEQSKLSVISEHIINYDHTFDWENTKILDCEPRFYKRIVSEMIHIKEQKVSLNLNSDTELLDETYFDIIKELGHY